MKKIVKLITLLLLSLTMALSDIVPVFADVVCSSKDERLIQYYEVNASSLNVAEADQAYIKGNIRIYNDDLSNAPRKWVLKIDGKTIDSKTAANYGDPILFTYQPTDKNYYTFTFMTSSGKLSYYHKTQKEEKTTSEFVLQIEEGTQSIYFYANTNSSTVTASKKELNRKSKFQFAKETSFLAKLSST